MAALAEPQSSGPSVPGRGRAAQRYWGAPPPGTAPGGSIAAQTHLCLRSSLSRASSQRARTEGAEKSKRPDNALRPRAPTATAAAAVGGSGVSSAPVSPSKSHRRLPKAGAGQAGAGPVGRRVPQPTWPPFAPAPAGRGRRCGGAGLAPPRAPRLRQERRGGRCRPGPTAGSCPREAREARTLTHLEGRRKLGCGRGMRGSLLVWVTLNLASL